MLRFAVASALWLIGAWPVVAQTYPSRSITIIVSFAAGASSDATARAIANELGPRLGVNVIVENRGGGGGVIGLQAMSRAQPDGHTLGIGAAGAVVVIPMLPNPPKFDPAKDIVPVARLVNVPLVMVAHPTVGPTSLSDIIAKAKATPAGLTYGSTGTNSGMHLAVEFLAFKTGAKLVHVPYRGSAPAVNDAVAGQVPFVAVDLTVAAPLVRAGKLRGLAIITPQRASALPELPTMSELGYPGFETAPFLGMFAPAGTPEAVRTKLGSILRDIIAKAEVQKLLRTFALEPAFLDSAGFSKFLDEDRARWRGMLKSIGKLN
ncbi:MAG: Bug family tripartite tricarboxylate transporter substrate binding protein [Xanthobacteraceae bacterium]